MPPPRGPYPASVQRIADCGAGAVLIAGGIAVRPRARNDAGGLASRHISTHRWVIRGYSIRVTVGAGAGLFFAVH